MSNGYFILARGRKISTSSRVLLSGVSYSFFSSYQSVSQMWISFNEAARDAQDWRTRLLYFSS